jgi:transcriptional regulator with XRE-family HTH domain
MWETWGVCEMALEDRLSLGALVIAYRTLADAKAYQLAELLDLHPSQISNLENNRPPRPDRHFIERLGRALRLADFDRTQLLCAADLPPSRQEVDAARLLEGPLLDDLVCPACLQDYRGFIWYVNRLWHEQFGDAPLGAHLLYLLFDRSSGLRAFLEARGQEVWQAIARDEAAQWWRATRRWDIEAWGGPPEWVGELVSELAALPADAGGEFKAAVEAAQEVITATSRVGPLYGSARGLGVELASQQVPRRPPLEFVRQPLPHEARFTRLLGLFRSS